MPRTVELHPKVIKIVRTDERDKALSEFLASDTEDGFSSRKGIDCAWNEARRQYNAIPEKPVRDVPVPNAPNIEMPVGAILTDDLYAASLDTLFTASPLLTVRPTNKRFVEHAKAMQVFVDHLAAVEIDLRNAANNTIMDDTQLGTGFYYIPFVEEVQKTKTHKITNRHAQIFSISPEDVVLMPSSRGDLQNDRWVSIRFWLTEGELNERAKLRKWDIQGLMPSAHWDMVRMQHEKAARIKSNELYRIVYEVIETYCYFDYDGDGYEEDLMVVWDRNSRKIIDVRFNPYDRRPIEMMRYQLRQHVPYGLGVMEMAYPFQKATTELENYKLLNVFLCNSRVWLAKQGAVPESLEVYPGKVVNTTEDVNTAMKELKFSEVYPSLFQAGANLIQMAERRVGTSGSQGIMSKGGSRTPGVTALSLLQQVNRRFAPAFDDARETTAAAVRQAVMRYRERVRAGDKDIEDHIKMICGDEEGELVLDLMRIPELENSVAVEFTASSASINREADRQNAIMLVNILGQYYQQTVQLTVMAADPNTPESVRSVITKVAAAGTEIMDRTIRTFEQVRDPSTFLVEMGDSLEVANAEAQAMQQQAQQQQALAMLTGQTPQQGANPVEEAEDEMQPQSAGIA